MKRAILLLSLFITPLAFAGQQITGNLSVSGNVGIGTTSNTPINASLIVVSGNVGIGSTVPGQMLDVQGTVRTIGFTMPTGASNTYVLTSDANGNGSWSAASGGGSTPGGSATQLQYQVNGTTFGGVTGSSVVNGNIGIGSANPGQALDVAGTARMTGFSLPTNASSGYVLTSNNFGIGTWQAGGGTGTQTPWTSNISGAGFNLNAAGNVGLGGVASTNTAQLYIYDNSSEGAQIKLREDGSFSTSGILFNSNGSNYGELFSNLSTSNTNLLNIPYTTLIEADTNNTGGIVLDSVASAPIIFGTGGSANSNERMRILSGGNVGVGSTSPGQALDVTGTVRATNLVKTGGTSSQFLKADGSVDSNTYLTGNQSITWTGSGDLTGSASGTTSISPALTLATVNTNVGTFQGLTVNGKGLVTAAANQSYLTANQTITASGDATGSGTTSLPLTLATVNSNTGSFTSANITVNGKGLITAASTGGSSSAGGLNAIQYSNPVGTFAGKENIFSFNGTNVGIGTVNGRNLLDVQGTVTSAAFEVTPAGNVSIGTLGPTSALQVVGNVGIGTSASMGTSPNQLNVNNFIGVNNEYQIPGNIGIGTTNVNWNYGNFQNVGIGTSGTNTYMTFTAPVNSNAANLQLRILEDSTGSRALPYWPATVKWAGGSVPTLSGANKADFVNCFWNGTSYYCQSAANF